MAEAIRATFNRKSDLQRIMDKTGRKLVSCKCKTCQSQCLRSPCMGTPQDIEKIIDAGFGKRIFYTGWRVGQLWGLVSSDINMYQAELTPNGCTFFKDGLCQLHDAGLKPTEGRLSHHTITDENTDRRKHLSWQVAKTWLDPQNQSVILRIKLKLAALNF